MPASPLHSRVWALTSAQALFRPLSPDFTPLPPASLQLSPRRTRSESAPRLTAPHFFLCSTPPPPRIPARPGPGPSPSPQTPAPAQATSQPACPCGSAPRPGLSAVTGWSRPPDAGAAQPIGGCHTAARAGLGGVGISGFRSALARSESAGRGCVVAGPTPAVPTEPRPC